MTDQHSDPSLPSSAARQNQTPHALVIDDERHWQTIVGEILTDLGFKVTTLSAPPAEVSAYQLAILDVSLDPTETGNRAGLSVCDRLAELGTPCVILSGLPEADLADEMAQRPNVLQWMSKESFRREALIDLIRRQPGLLQPEGPHIIIVEDDTQWRAIYVDILEDAGYALHTAASYAEARGWLQRMEFALAIVDLHLISSAAPQDNRDGFWLLRAAHQRGLPTIVVSALGVPEDVDRAYDEFGVFAFVEKEGFDRRTFRNLVAEAIQVQPSDFKAVPPAALAAIEQRTERQLADLTERERDVLALLVEGCTNRIIAERLGVSSNTVKKHVDHIFQKLEVSSRAGAVAVALRAGAGTSH
jgi:DNA-binding NarL/FixJ family response regulator